MLLLVGHDEGFGGFREAETVACTVEEVVVVASVGFAEGGHIGDLGKVLSLDVLDGIGVVVVGLSGAVGIVGLDSLLGILVVSRTHLGLGFLVWSKANITC